MSEENAISKDATTIIIVKTQRPIIDNEHAILAFIASDSASYS